MSSAVAGHIATLFGLGRFPYAPGTVASLVALPFAGVIMLFAGPLTLAALGVIAALLGSWACEIYVRERADKDPSECVIDELAGQWLACAFAPLAPWGFALAFFLFRLLDIIKPWPISAAERMGGGAGVMADDVVAGLIAGLIVLLVARLGLV